jgi:hypothetical protein
LTGAKKNEKILLIPEREMFDLIDTFNPQSPCWEEAGIFEFKQYFKMSEFL